MQTSIPFAHNFILHEPTATGNFGKTHPFIFQFIRQIAQEEGFLTDPVYTAKLFFEGKHILSKGETPGNVLFLHSGGALSLTGFLDQLH